MVIVLIDSCYSNKIPQTGWFINTSIAPMVLEAESSRYWTVYSILQREKNIVGILWLCASSFITPSRRSDSSAWRTRGETDCLWLTPFPLIQLWRIQEDFLEEVMAKSQRMRRKGEYVGMVLGRYQNVEIPRGKRKHGCLGERQKVLHSWSIG